MTEKPTHIDIGYSKGPSFRTIRADGAWGGITPKLEIFMALWSERPSIPDRVRYLITGELLGPEEPKFNGEGGLAAMRDVEVGISMDKATATQVMEWLKERIAQIEQIEKSNKEREQKTQVK